jgi:hypothetical protein
MSMLTRQSLDHITDARAQAAIRDLRNKVSGLKKVYGIRYVAALAEACKYQIGADVNGYYIAKGGVWKRFATAKSIGLHMEATINDWYALGVL